MTTRILLFTTLRVLLRGSYILPTGLLERRDGWSSATAFFIQVADLVYHHRRCIPLRLDDILARKRDVLVFGRMICNFYEIDDMQGLRLDFIAKNIGL